MTASAPVSILSTDQLLRLALFNRSVADELDTAFVASAEVVSAADLVIDSGLLTTSTAEQNRVALQTALNSAANFGGARVRCRNDGGGSETTYQIGRAGTTSWSVDVPGDNVTIESDKGVWLQHPVGMPDATVAMIRINERTNITIRDIGIDGNWGNSVNGTDSNVGLNHTTQVDPSNYGIWVRGSTNVTIEDVVMRQIYGDGVWIGGGATTGIATKDLKISRCRVDLSARSGLAFVGYAQRVSVRDCEMLNIFASAVDFEPQADFRTLRDIVFENCHFGRWWTLTRVPLPVTIVGSVQVAPHDSSAARGVRMTDCQIDGPVLIASAYDCVIERCRIVCDFSANCRAPIYIDHMSDEIRILDTYVYDRGGSAGAVHLGAVQVSWYSERLKPASVTLRGLRIHAKNGRAGIVLDGLGGQLGDTGTASAVSATTLTDASKSAVWTTDQFQGCLVRMGGITAAVVSNTTTVLTLQGWIATPAGNVIGATPGAGTYEILARNGNAVVDDCEIDCSNDSNGQGGVGVYIDAGDVHAVPMRGQIKLRDVTIHNATADGVQVKSRDPANPFRLLSFKNVHVVDDQVTPTCTVGIRFLTAPAVNATKVLLDNITVDGVANVLAGVGAASPNLIRWLVRDGETSEWAGYGTPEGFVTALKGSTYRRKDGGAATCFYVKESDTTNTGWVAK